MYTMVNSHNFTFRITEHYRDMDEPRYLRFNAPSTITINEFIEKILQDMTRESLMNIYKLNICQYCEHISQVLPFITECEGELDIHTPNHLSATFDTIRRNLLEEYED